MNLKKTFRSSFPLLIFIFIFIATFSFLKLRDVNETSATSLANFKAGNIISDYVMSNYTSMSESEIQKFLESKVTCNNTDYSIVEKYTTATVKFHFKDGHFVCLPEETFGEGTKYGEDAKNGESAAHIIYQAAQEYKINPQVLIVLLQKEQGLITDNFPNSYQYRSATGYGCPDTAACDSKYYGFKNQVNNAARLFRAVLDGGWTNYPLGKNYIQYNPNAACGGSEVYIENLATSALYRYTPYQPNSAALAAGYGTAACGAYGNRNFYLYFSDWFGDITSTGYKVLDSPRYFELKDDADRINPQTLEIIDTLEKGKIIKYSSEIKTADGETCYRTEHNTNNNINACVLLKNLKEITLTYEDIPKTEQEKFIKSNAQKTKLQSGDTTQTFSTWMVRKFTKKITLLGVTYYITEFDAKNNNSQYGIAEKYLSEVPTYENLETKVYLELSKNTNRLKTFTGEKYDSLSKGRIIYFSQKIIIDGKTYYRTEHNTNNHIDAVVPADATKPAPEYENFQNPRQLKIKSTVNRINPYTGAYYDTLLAGRVIKFTTKIKINNVWYYRTEHNTNNHIDAVVPASAVSEL